MNVISAIVTSKGQVTLPKTIRDLLRLNTGDKVDFFINENHQVIMKKNIVDVDTEALFNLIMLFLENKHPITINGNSGSGKTTFVANLIAKKFAGQKVGIMDPLNGLYNILKDSLDKDDLNKIVLIPNKISVDEIVKHQLDLFVIDETREEAQLNLIKAIKEQDIRFIAIKHFFDIKEVSQIGNHISVSMGSRGEVNKIENIQFKNDECIRTPIYIS